MFLENKEKVSVILYFNISFKNEIFKNLSTEAVITTNSGKR